MPTQLPSALGAIVRGWGAHISHATASTANAPSRLYSQYLAAPEKFNQVCSRRRRISAHRAIDQQRGELAVNNDIPGDSECGRGGKQQAEQRQEELPGGGVAKLACGQWDVLERMHGAVVRIMVTYQLME